MELKNRNDKRRKIFFEKDGKIYIRTKIVTGGGWTKPSKSMTINELEEKAIVETPDGYALQIYIP